MHIYACNAHTAFLMPFIKPNLGNMLDSIVTNIQTAENNV